MARFEEVGPRAPVAEATRVDKIKPGARTVRNIRALVVILLALLLLFPVFVMAQTAFKSRSDVVSVPPKLIFEPTLEGFVFLLTDRAVVSKTRMPEYQAAAEAGELGLFERIALRNGQVSVTLGLFAAYAFSRFEIPGKGDLLFFILSTRMLPAVVVTIPLFLMFRQVGLHDTHAGMILLYTVFNLSLAVWLLKGFIDEIPREYEEAAMVDGYSRLQAFYKLVIPQALTGIAATAVFCLIFAWNEYAFALMLTSDTARTAPPSIVSNLGRGGIEWSAIAAGTLGFLIPVVIVTFALRRYLLRGVTFGAIRQ
jgi:multiple sugar transport system permease protein